MRNMKVSPLNNNYLHSPTINDFAAQQLTWGCCRGSIRAWKKTRTPSSAACPPSPHSLGTASPVPWTPSKSRPSSTPSSARTRTSSASAPRTNTDSRTTGAASVSPCTSTTLWKSGPRRTAVSGSGRTRATSLSTDNLSAGSHKGSLRNTFSSKGCSTCCIQNCIERL